MQQFSTPLHDMAHQWIYDNKNRFKVLQSVAQKKGFNLDKENYSSSIDIERPIFYNETRKFIVDGVIDPFCGSGSSMNGSSRINTTTVKSFAGKDLRMMQGAIYRRVIYEIKPKLDSISNSVGQIKSYQHFLTYYRWKDGVKSDRLYNPELVLLTLDVTTTYDELCASQGIQIFHIPPKTIQR
jgi:hypothetical protein